MQTRHLVIATAFVASLGLGACSSNPTNAQIGTGAGAVVGGVAGTAGAIAGAAGGALVGHELGEDRDQRRR